MRGVTGHLLLFTFCDIIEDQADAAHGLFGVRIIISLFAFDPFAIVIESLFLITCQFGDGAQIKISIGIIINPDGTASQRVGNAWKGKKLVSLHDFVLVFQTPDS